MGPEDQTITFCKNHPLILHSKYLIIVICTLFFFVYHILLVTLWKINTLNSISIQKLLSSNQKLKFLLMLSLYPIRMPNCPVHCLAVSSLLNLQKNWHASVVWREHNFKNELLFMNKFKIRHIMHNDFAFS